MLVFFRARYSHDACWCSQSQKAVFAAQSNNALRSAPSGHRLLHTVAGVPAPGDLAFSQALATNVLSCSLSTNPVATKLSHSSTVTEPYSTNHHMLRHAQLHVRGFLSTTTYMPIPSHHVTTFFFLFIQSCRFFLPANFTRLVKYIDLNVLQNTASSEKSILSRCNVVSPLFFNSVFAYHSQPPPFPSPLSIYLLFCQKHKTHNTHPPRCQYPFMT